MTDRFEQRLSLDLRTLAEGGVRPVDRRAIAEHAIALGRPRGIPAYRGIRLVLVAALLGAGLVAALIASGMKLTEPQFDATSGRIMVWLPAGGDFGATYVFDEVGKLGFSGRKFSTRCPTLLPGGRIALYGSGFPRGLGTIRIETDDGQAVEEIEVGGGTNQYWAPDREALVLVDSLNGATTVVRFGQGTTRYGANGELAGAVDAAVSNGGTRVVVAVQTDMGVDLHLLDGGDTVIYRLEPFDGQAVNPELRVTPDGSRVAMVYANTTGRFPEPHVVIVSLPDGAAVTARLEVVPSLDYQPISWSPDGSTFALLYGSSVHLYDVATESWRDPGWRVNGPVELSRWRSMAGGEWRMAIFDGTQVSRHREGAGLGRAMQFERPIAFSPDGNDLAYLVGSASEDVQAGFQTRVWTIDIWGERRNRYLATVPEDRPAYIGEPCIDWQPGGTP